MQRKLIIFSIVFAGFVFLFWFGTHVFRPLPEGYYAELEVGNGNSQQIDFSQDTPTPLNTGSTSKPDSIKQTAWIPDWDFENGFKSLQNNVEFFDSVSPVWYHLNKDGTVKVNRAGRQRLQAFTKQNNLKLMPSIASFDPNEFHAILSDPEKLKRHQEFLLSEVETYNLDGLDLDYESIYLEDHPELIEFVSGLYTELDAQGKTLSFAVMPNWADTKPYYSLIQTRASQDWYELGRYVHELRIMSYNLTNYNSRYPGPVSPVDWQAGILRYGVHRLDPEKVLLGMGLYGYDGWSENPEIPDPYLGLTANPATNKGRADAVTYEQVSESRLPHQTDQFIDQASGEKVLEYKFEGKNYTVFFTDQASVLANAELMNIYEIAGIAYWRMGGEDQSIYRRVSNF